MTGFQWQIAAAACFAAALGVPRWILNFLKKKRQKKFLDEFANAIDVIVRGIKAGLPVNDTLKVIAVESPDPVGTRVPGGHRRAEARCASRPGAGAHV